jgi:hypothetical protein
MRWIHVVRDRTRRRALVDAAMNSAAVASSRRITLDIINSIINECVKINFWVA